MLEIDEKKQCTIFGTVNDVGMRSRTRTRARTKIPAIACTYLVQ